MLDKEKKIFYDLLSHDMNTKTENSDHNFKGNRLSVFKPSYNVVADTGKTGSPFLPNNNTGGGDDRGAISLNKAERILFTYHHAACYFPVHTASIDKVFMPCKVNKNIIVITKKHYEGGLYAVDNQK
jgi:hypothetical protein